MADLNGRMFERRGNHLVPSDLAAQEMVESLPEGKAVLMDMRRARSVRNHAHLFAILRVATEQLDGYPDEETLLDAVKIATNLTRPVTLASGEIIWIPKSINWAAMPEDEFRRWKNRALYVLGQLLGVDPQQLLEEVGAKNGRNYSRDDRPEPPTSAYEDTK
jgi:hypothetical protein